MAQRRVEVQQRSVFFSRQETVLSDDGERYEVLPLPSPGMEEPDSPGYHDDVNDGINIGARIPYMSIYSSPSRLITAMNAGFLSGTPITLKFIKASRDTALTHPLNPYLYTIEVTHGPFKWIIYKRFKHFRDLHDKLWAHRTSLKIPLPSKSHRQKRRTVKVDKNEPKLPRFPKRPDMWVSADLIDRRQEQLESYLNALLQSSMYKKHSTTKKFLEISKFSFIQDLGIKGKEGPLRKKSGGHRINLYFCDKCCNLKCRELFNKWSTRWFVVKDTFCMYLDPDTQTIKGILLFDNKLKVEGKENSSKLTISNSSRQLRVNCWTDRQAGVWKDAIINTAAELGADFVTPNPFSSFAPTREAPAHWFVDGSSYFAAVADAIEEAKEEIFITDWWLSPQIYLKRPMTEGSRWQLDKLLKRKADCGVKVYVLLYKEVEMAVALQSRYTKDALQSLNSNNIKVLRHPDHIATTADSLLWAHHEKIVVIDQITAFIGGIDLCYGRWDNHTHPLTDLGVDLLGEDAVDGHVMTGAKTSSAFVMFQSMAMAVVEEVSKDEPDRREVSTADVELNLRRLSTSSDQLDGDGEGDNDSLPGGKSKTSLVVAQERTTLLKTNGAGYGSISMSDTIPLIASESPAASSYDSAKQWISGAGEMYKGMLENIKMVGQSKLWVGKDYCNFIAKDLTNLDDPYNDLIDRASMPRMPWHDIACVTYGKPARDAARHFIQRWNFTKIEKAKKGETVPFLVPKAYTNEALHIPQNVIHPSAVSAKVQVLRSCSEWSAGVIDPEFSIQNAYIEAINNAEHYIYIENQFFISVRNNPDISNKIVDALYFRILRAHEENKKFRVYVIMPLIPGFEGDISDSSKSLAIQAVMFWQYRSIIRGQGSLLGDLLAKIGPSYINYVSFCGLRTHSELGGKPISEIIYVHSKMLIVDDRKVIIGSANINERSMTGLRDSEVAMYVEDTEMIDSTMDGKPFQVGRFASSLRKRVFAEHLGLLPEEFEESNFEPTQNIDDVVSDKFFKDIWLRFAGVNTTVHEKAFKCVPSDSVARFSDIEDFQKNPMTDIEDIKTELKKIHGFLVLLPLFFLKDEDLRPEGMTKENLAPTALWT